MPIILHPKKDKSVRRGYPWVFRNQIRDLEESPKSGSVVGVVSADGDHLGQALYHSRSQIALRMVTPDPAAVVDSDFFVERLREAVRFRQQILPEATHARLVYGESDGLPGVVIDRYGDFLTWTCISAGMEQYRDALLEAARQMVGARHVVERNDNVLREKDGLKQRSGFLSDEADPIATIVEAGLRFGVDVVGGPKTGFFIDQRFHRAHIRRYARSARVADVFCADGGFGLHAAHAGAVQVDLVDSSSAALDRAEKNAARNGLSERVSVHKADALSWLSQSSDKSKYDLVILDPPAFARRRRDVEQAVRAYQSININALRMLDRRGILATSSCSQALTEEHFLKIIRYAARKAGRTLRLLYRGCHPPDHPILDSMPETAYLKFFVFQCVEDRSTQN